MSERQALIVDDEADIRALLEITLSRMGISTRAAVDLRDAKQLLARERFDLCLTDMRLPDGSGIGLVRLIQEQHPELPVAVITAYGNMEDAVESLKAGAFDFVSKPVDIEVLRKLIDTALRLKGVAPEAGEDGTQPMLLGNAPAIIELRATIAKLARSQAPVHICGESGTGKELVARMIHKSGPRAGGPFVPVNCGAIPSELMESEFFGHVKGSFSGATRDKLGLFQAAQGGTLFLDEVADLPLHMQVKLLRAIQERAVRPVGAERELPTDLRILSATHKALGELVNSGEFRQDLFYRLNVIEVRVPPLRERTEDIADLSAAILRRLAQNHGRQVPRLDKGSMNELQAYGFPGNVRELENMLERALTLCEDDCIRAEDLRISPVEGFADPLAPPIANSSESIDEKLQNLERERIEQALEQARYNKTRAAKLLGISFRSLRYRLKKLGID